MEAGQRPRAGIETKSSPGLFIAGVALLAGAFLMLLLANGGIVLGSGPSQSGSSGMGNMAGGGGMGMMGGMGGMGGMGSSGMPMKTTFSSNGERIFYTGVSSSGQPIPYNNGPMWLSMHGGSCVSCHGPEGRGGQPIMMSSVLPRDIRYAVLTSDHSGSGDGHNHAPYTDALIKQAITKGIRPDGQLLDKTMPRWQMSDQDLDDVIAYLKTLPVSSAELVHHDSAGGHTDSNGQAMPGMAMGSESDHTHTDGGDHASMAMPSSGEQPSNVLLLSLVALVGVTFGTVFFLKRRELAVSLPAAPVGGGDRPDGA